MDGRNASDVTAPCFSRRRESPGHRPPSPARSRSGNAPAMPRRRRAFGVHGFPSRVAGGWPPAEPSRVSRWPQPALGSVDSFSVERTEVIRGPGAVVHGSHGIGGTEQALGRSRPGTAGSGTDGCAVCPSASAKEGHAGRLEGGWDSRDVSVSMGARRSILGPCGAGGDGGVSALGLAPGWAWPVGGIRWGRGEGNRLLREPRWNPAHQAGAYDGRLPVCGCNHLT